MGVNLDCPDENVGSDTRHIRRCLMFTPLSSHVMIRIGREKYAIVILMPNG